MRRFRDRSPLTQPLVLQARSFSGGQASQRRGCACRKGKFTMAGMWLADQCRSQACTSSNVSRARPEMLAPDDEYLPCRTSLCLAVRPWQLALPLCWLVSSMWPQHRPSWALVKARPVQRHTRPRRCVQAQLTLKQKHERHLRLPGAGQADTSSQ
jgi:hypothetical protein